MGRRRRKDLHLPKRMYLRAGKFYFDSPVTKRWEPLGADLAEALAAYGRLIGPLWSGRSLRDLFQRYKTTVTPLRTVESTRDNERRTLDRFERIFGDLGQDALTQQHLYQYIDRREDERPQFKGKPAPSAGRHDVRFLRKVLAKGIKWGTGTANAAAGLEFDPDPVAVREVLLEEYQAVYALADERMQIAMELAANIGQRRGDLLQIQPRRDFTDEGILLRQGKTGTPLLIEWTPALRATVERAKALKPDLPRTFLLRNRAGEGYTPSGFGANWRRLMAKATSPGPDGAPPTLAARFKFHDLRKKAATEKAEATTVQEAQELLGHARESTTRRNYLARIKPKKVRPVR